MDLPSVGHMRRWYVLAVSIVLVPLGAASRARAGHAGSPDACSTASRAALRRPAVDSLFAGLAADSARDLRGVIVVRCGAPVAERYFNGADARTLHDVRSATKSITALLVGTAIAQGLLPGTDASIADLLPPGVPPAQRPIRLADLLTMRSGLDADDRNSASAGNEDRLDASPDWLAFANACPVRRPPGTRYVYASLNAFLAGATIERATGEPLSVYAERTLFRPLGITRYAWRRGPRGEGVGQGNLSLTARDLAAVGELMRTGGQAGGRQVIPRGWVDSVWTARVPIGDVDPYADSYGYFWYAKQYVVGGRPTVVHFASGNGGNKIYVVPSAGLVVAVTSAAYGRGYGQRRSERILRAVLDAAVP